MGCGCRKPRVVVKKDQDALDKYAFLTPAQIRAKESRKRDKVPTEEK